MWPLCLWAALAWAADPPVEAPVSRSTDLSVTTLGADVVSAQTIGRQNANLLLGQRLRWTLAKDTRALVDGRFAYDPGASIGFENSRLRELGVAYEREGFTLLVGRHPVVDGGPRLVDGVQGVANVGPDHRISVGAWAGLVPYEFSTAPTTRFGAGPIASYTSAQASVSAMGEVVVGAGGLDRLGGLVLARGELGSRLELDGRADMVLADGAGHSGLADGQLLAQLRPTKAMKIEALYDGYSSLLYQSSADQNPHVTRFAQRLEDLDLTDPLQPGEVDSTLYHLVGLTFAQHGTGEVRPEVALRARALLYPDPTQAYQRVGGTAGVAGLAGDRLQLDVDGNVLWVDQGMGGDAGLIATVEPDPNGAFAIDGSFRVLVDPDEFLGYPGWYADLFVAWMTRSGTSLDAGVSWNDEPSDLVGQDVGISGLLRLQQWVRPGRSSRGSLGDSRRADPTPVASDSTAPQKGPTQ